MGKINLGRVIMGGLLAGLVINIGEFVLNAPILGKDWDAAMGELGRTAIGGQQIAVFVVMGFFLGITAVWTYAAVRPRMGPGPKTAICAGSLIWALAYLYPSIGYLVLDLFPSRLIWIGLIWGLVEIPLATVAGAWLYKEE